jgi:hypothetical protein
MDEATTRRRNVGFSIIDVTSEKLTFTLFTWRAALRH